MVRSYRDLIVWQRAIKLVKSIYELTNDFPTHEVYGLTSQLRRAAVSVPSNIAEGQVRQSTKEFKRFLAIALGSLAETDTQIVIANELGYVTTEETKQLTDEINQLRRMIFSLRNKLPTSH